MLSLCLLASTCKNVRFFICKTLKRAANSYGVLGPDVPKINNQCNVVSIILLITMVWGGRGDGLDREGRRNQEPTYSLYQAIPASKVHGSLNNPLLTVRLKVGKAETC